MADVVPHYMDVLRTLLGRTIDRSASSADCGRLKRISLKLDDGRRLEIKAAGVYEGDDAELIVEISE